ncbi:binding protein-protein-dependent transport system inner membrane component [Roseibacterium elongatum DSM 19469]|uniref:Binding protein-protein-dependent transport system inner membrane component n=1 Tax=Roseicyclus elongatus DSM 19469 TaxID=1294273 RepID=W8S6D7_9RHOB|nr:sugar ABC transporter permease [Roseibacterium elongatum]AHM05832.1 binding protein-protein-dependent transport system inner membrane component [Roseibacterium elongatum DSM 19469]
MPHRTFFWFILPSLTAMFLFIALPIVSVVIQSLHVEHEQVLEVVETCGPFGCNEETRVDSEATRALREAEPLGRFNGLGTYVSRAHLATDELAAAWAESDSLAEFGSQVMNLPFYKALAFTLAYTFIVTPLVLVLGLAIALGVNGLPQRLRGVTIFFSLLPMIVTPLIGSLVLFWMIDADGIIGATLQLLFDDPELSLKASPTLTWLTLFVYGVWHSAPFAFIVFYAGLQTVPEETLEAAMIDGASRWERVRYVVIPHLMPLVVFITLIQLMDNFRVFEPIVGFQAQASATSLSYIIYSDLRGDTQQFGSAAATSVLTILGVAILLTPVLIRTWRDFNRKRA